MPIPYNMNNYLNTKTVFISLFFLTISVYVHAQDNPGQEGLLRLLPIETQLKGLKIDGSPEMAAGQELYMLINGGAEIYMQEGFKRAILATYINTDGKTINLEIFEMESPESANRIHAKKIGQQGKKLPIGEDALLEDYFLNFRKGSFQVTLSGYDSEPETVEMLLDLANMVANKIPSSN